MPGKKGEISWIHYHPNWYINTYLFFHQESALCYTPWYSHNSELINYHEKEADISPMDCAVTFSCIVLVTRLQFFVQIHIRGIWTDSKFILWTKIGFYVKHLVNLSIIFCQKLPIRGSSDLLNSVHLLDSIFEIQLH